MFSNIIVDPKTKRNLLVSDLLSGVRTEVSDLELKDYDMFPISGTIKHVDGTVLNLVELLEIAGSSGGSGTIVSNEWKSYYQSLKEEHKNDIVVIDNKFISLNDLIEQLKKSCYANFDDINVKVDKNIANINTKVDNGIIDITDKVNKNTEDLNIKIDKNAYVINAKVDKNVDDINIKIETLKKISNMEYKGVFSTFEIMSTNLSSPKTGYTALIGEQNAKKIMYIFNGSQWESFGEFNFEIRDFNIKPIELNKEITGMLDLKHIDVISLKNDLSSQLIEEEF